MPRKYCFLKQFVVAFLIIKKVFHIKKIKKFTFNKISDRITTKLK